MKSIARFLVSALSVILTAYVLPGVNFSGDSKVWTAIVVAAILGLLNTFLKPILVLLSIPVTFFTLGLFLLVINGFTVWLTDKIVPGFDVDSFFWAIIFSIVLSIINSITESILGLKDKKKD